ncbi:MAG: 3-deoxy-7-phosphoheptulonate synthase class II, partial [Gammaproteobacteria bacterium]|nr:3-deoxy-7-phosphoheptulonate synthase class II [Gammaproteobacteria bacterium]
MKILEVQSWSPTSWQSRTVRQQPTYRDQEALQLALAQLSSLPPIVVSWEVERLREELASAQNG